MNIPYYFERDGSDPYVCDKDGNRVCTLMDNFGRTEQIAIARFIVRACNSHADLLAALRLIQLNARTALEYMERERCDSRAASTLANIENWPGMVAARAAIAKVECELQS